MGRGKAYRFLISTINTHYSGKKSSLTILLHTAGNSPSASVEDRRIGSRNPYRYQVLQMLKSLIENGIITAHNLYTSFPGGTDGKKSACNARDPGSICGSRRSPGEGHGNPLQYSCLENPMDRGAWWTTVHEVSKSWTGLSD